MPAPSVSRTIAAEAPAVWELLVTTAWWPEWGLSVAGHEGPDRISAGSTGSVTTVVGLSLPYVISDFVEGRHWSWRVAGIPATRHAVQPHPDDPQASTLHFTAPRWAFLYLPVLWWSARAVARLAESARSEGSAA